MRLSWWYVVVAGVLAVLLSGLPQGLADLHVDHPECCDPADACPSSDGAGHCPPNCSFGACAKIVSATLHVSAPDFRAAVAAVTSVSSQRLPIPGGVHADVFHPPRPHRA